MVVAECDSEEQCRISKILLDLPVGKQKCIITIDGKVTNNGVAGTSRRNIAFSEHSFTFLFEGKYILFVFSLLIPEEGSQIIYFFLTIAQNWRGCKSCLAYI